ncbi:MAG TPA: hypothetical protein ENN64_00480 [bacterium]|nr:hypothetical protein [bacterium]
MRLTEAAHWAKRLGTILFVVLFLVIVFLYITTLEPRKKEISSYTTPDFACTLTADEFKNNKLSIPSLSLGPDSKMNFTIDTPTGRIDDLPTIVNVFEYDNPGEMLNSLDLAKDIAKNLGFTDQQMERIGTKEYKWVDPTTARTLRIQARNLTFTLETDFSNPNALPEKRNIPTDIEAKRAAINFLQSTSGLLPADYAQNDPYLTYIKLDRNGNYTQSRSKAETDLIRVDFFRKAKLMTLYSSHKDYNEIIKRFNRFEQVEDPDSTSSQTITHFMASVSTLSFTNGNISVYIGSPRDERRSFGSNAIYQINYKNWYLNPEPCGTYELITSNEAIEMLKNGNGSLIYLVERNGDTVRPYSPQSVTRFSILNVTLGYYDPPFESRFMQPIYIISGEATFDTGVLGDFIYYVPAIKYEVIEDFDPDKVSDPTDIVEDEGESGGGLMIPGL